MLRLPRSVLECFLFHTTYLKNLPVESRAFLDSYLGVSLTYISLKEYLSKPADSVAHTKMINLFRGIRGIDQFVELHDSLLPRTLSSKCSGEILDRSYFIHRGWGDMSLESSIELPLMTSFTFTTKIAEGFSLTGRITTVKITPDVLNNSLYIGEMARVKEEEEIIIFPGTLTRVHGDLYSYKPYDSHYLRNKIEDRRQGLQHVLDDLKMRGQVERNRRMADDERRKMQKAEVRDWILEVYESLRSDEITPPLTVFASSDGLSWEMTKHIAKGAVVHEMSTDMDGIIRGKIRGDPVRILFDLKYVEESTLIWVKDDTEYKLYIAHFMYKGRKHTFI